MFYVSSGCPLHHSNGTFNKGRSMDLVFWRIFQHLAQSPWHIQYWWQAWNRNELINMHNSFVRKNWVEEWEFRNTFLLIYLLVLVVVHIIVRWCHKSCCLRKAWVFMHHIPWTIACCLICCRMSTNSYSLSNISNEILLN